MELVESLLQIAQEAAQVILEVYRSPFGVEYKGPRDPVTEADLRANRLICSRLHSLYPDIPVVAEESDECTFAGFRRSERIFFVDPVDGTAEFVDRNGQFVVMIGLLEGHCATSGVVLAPVQNRAWLGQVGKGAERLETDGSRTPISVSDTSELSQARVVASRSHRSDDLEALLKRLGTKDMTALGSAGLKAVAISDASADLYVAPGRAGKRWDACAPDAIVHAAGGRYTDLQGVRIDYRAPGLENRGGLIAANVRLHAAILARLASEDRP